LRGDGLVPLFSRANLFLNMLRAYVFAFGYFLLTSWAFSIILWW
jgi:hypothetical protein